MKKALFVSFFLMMGLLAANAQGFDMDMFLHVNMDSSPKATADDIFLSARLGISGAYEKEITPLLAPGAKVQVGLFPLGSMLKEPIWLFDFSGRVFNGMRFGSAEFQPFIGYTFRTAAANHQSYSAGYPEVGLEVIIGMIGLECAYVIPGSSIIVPAFGSLPKDVLVSGNAGAVRFGASWHLRSRSKK